MDTKTNQENRENLREKIIKSIVDTPYIHNPFFFSHPSYDNFRMDRELCLAAISRAHRSILGVSDELTKDQTFLLESAKANSWVLEFDHLYSKTLRGNKEFMVELANHEPFVLRFATSELKDDKDLVLAAVSRRGSMLHCVSENLQEDIEVVLAAVKNDRDAFKYASDKIHVMCRGQEPVKYLESKILADDLQVSLMNKPGVPKTKKVKL